MFSSRTLVKKEIIIQQYQKKNYSPSTNANLITKVSKDEKRTCSSISGSLTVEAAIVLPIFVFAILSLILLGQTAYTQTRLQNAMEVTAEKVASYSYAERLVKEKVNGLDSVIGEWIIDCATILIIKNEVIKTAGKNYLDHCCIQNGSDGISFIGSTVSVDEEFVDLILSYRIRSPVPIFFNNQLWITQRCRRKLWIGEESTQEKEEPIVYVTVNGSVYHTSLECSYLKRNIRQVDYSDIKSQRNETGAKYYRCEFCAKGEVGEWVYITNYGDRYHYRTTCPGLTRGIRTILYSDIGERQLCKKCQQNEK